MKLSFAFFMSFILFITGLLTLLSIRFQYLFPPENEKQESQGVTKPNALYGRKPIGPLRHNARNFETGFGEEKEFDIAIFMAGRLFKSRVYGRGNIEDAREVCREKNSTLPWQTFSIRLINVTSDSVYRFIKKGAFWLSTNITRESVDKEVEKEIGGELVPKLRVIGNQTAQLILRAELGKEKTYCAVSSWITRFSRYVCKNDTFDSDGRVLIYSATVPHCEVKKLDIEFIQKYNLMQQEYADITYHGLSKEFSTSFLTGYSLEEFEAEKHGIPWCENNPRLPRGVFATERGHQTALVPGYNDTSAYAVCIKKEPYL